MSRDSLPRLALSRRRLRLLRVASARWQRRGVFVLGGAAIGLAAVVFSVLADQAQAAFRLLALTWPALPLLLTPVGFAATVALARRFFPNSQGSGIPQAIAARQLRRLADRQSLVSGRIAVGKVLLTLLGLLVGSSAGREGPTVQVGASIMFLAGRLSPRRQPGLILAGAAAGVAAAFNTPLAGIVFGIEEMSRSFEVRASGLVIGTIIAAGLVSLAIQGNYTYFGSTAAMLHSSVDWAAVPLCGLGGGLAGGLFSRLLVSFSDGSLAALSRFGLRRPLLFAFLCGFLVAVGGMLSHEPLAGTGYDEARALLGGESHLSWTFGPLKLLATLLSAVSGIPGGIFSPSLAVGAGIGADIARLLGTAPEPVVLLGMVAYFAGVVQAPITAFVIVTEMTDNHAMLVPLMGSAVIAQAASRLICKEGVYHALAHRFVALAHQSSSSGSPI